MSRLISMCEALRSGSRRRIVLGKKIKVSDFGNHNRIILSGFLDGSDASTLCSLLLVELFGVALSYKKVG